jgi:ABC-type transporter Mla MlaB component
MISVNSAIVALYGYLQADKMAVAAAQKAVWLSAIPAAGAIVCLAWVALLTSYRKLNRAKFTVLTEIEADLPVALFTREREAYRRDRRWSLSNVERVIPGCFALLYAVMLVAAVVTRAADLSAFIKVKNIWIVSGTRRS